MRSWALSCSTARVCIIMPTRSIPEAPKLGRCFSIVGWSRASRADIVLVYIMAHRPWIAAGFVTVCCQSGQLLWQHMHGLSFTHKSWAESLECIHGPEVTLATMHTVCESAAKQCPSWSIVEVANNKLHKLQCMLQLESSSLRASFKLTLHSGSSPSLSLSTELKTVDVQSFWNFWIRSIKIMWPQTYIHSVCTMQCWSCAAH